MRFVFVIIGGCASSLPGLLWPLCSQRPCCSVASFSACAKDLTWLVPLLRLAAFGGQGPCVTHLSLPGGDHIIGRQSVLSEHLLQQCLHSSFPPLIISQGTVWSIRVNTASDRTPSPHSCYGDSFLPSLRLSLASMPLPPHHSFSPHDAVSWSL